MVLLQKERELPSTYQTTPDIDLLILPLAFTSTAHGSSFEILAGRIEEICQSPLRV
ncbi:hypothetical protein CY34DRAFT_809932 [Suillus luteus UH-Slu-Lm8-n1]|uniref:Uncharacterized protein n=1 Tax=Suillus luteus UH-Slu-Lm8-n1 TaxID=930992 RepID=A0A0D0B1G2_9AGAM|nr:hypothetical protein CY34DRAFT_809932 [Suillus luteus UH-Slu-Lm8-n1]